MTLLKNVSLSNGYLLVLLGGLIGVLGWTGRAHAEFIPCEPITINYNGVQAAQGWRMAPASPGRLPVQVLASDAAVLRNVREYHMTCRYPVGNSFFVSGRVGYRACIGVGGPRPGFNCTDEAPSM